MDDLSLYFSPVEEAVCNAEYDNFQLGAAVIMHKPDEFPDPEGSKVAIIGIPESRNNRQNKDNSLSPDIIRQFLYKLGNHYSSLKITDLGNLKIGETSDDTYEAVSEILHQLILDDIIPLVIGGSQDLTYANYLAYEKAGRVINIAAIDSRFDIGKPGTDFNNESWVNKIILRDPNFLFNFTNIGYQTYFTDPDAIPLLKKLYFDYVRLGLAREEISEMEPLLRNADLITVDMSAVRQADAPFSSFPSPNGFSGEEMCQMARFSGMSDKLTSFGLYEVCAGNDTQGQTAHLGAHILWHFLEGVAMRKGDRPHKNKDSFMKYIVSTSEVESDITFFRSPLSERWWMEVPCPGNLMSKYERHYMVPCTYNDYQQALKEIIPDRWWQTYQKFM
ncbi:MAG: arginase [Marinilabiliales bacterium]|nr:MAG: arginase [Marinilabiliales bacterium]